MKRATLAVVSLLCAAVPAAPGVAAPGKVVRVPSPDLDALPSRGPKRALVTIEVFLRMFTDVRVPEIRACERLQAEHPGTVRIVYRVLRAPSSSRLHYAVLEAQAEGRFEPFLDALERQQSTNPTDAQLFEIARAAGVDTDQLAEVLDNPPAAFDAILDENQRRLRLRFHTAMPGAILDGIAVTRNDLANKTGELERVYEIAKDEALDLLDRGVDPRALGPALEAASAPDLQRIEARARSSDPDDVVGDVPPTPTLATPPLDLSGLPSLGPPDAETTIAVLCVPSAATSTCRPALAAAQAAADAFGDRVRVVWAPFFDVTRDDAAELGMLADATLCAEHVAATGLDLRRPGSPGWQWLQKMMNFVAVLHHRPTADDVLADLVLPPDAPAFAACRAQQAGAAIRWVEAAMRAGVHAAPSTVVGGRIYPAITDTNVLQQLIAAELEPSVNCAGCLRLDALAPAWRGGTPP